MLSEVVEALHVPFLRAFNVDNMQEWEIFEQEEKCAGYVFDAVKPGSGETFDWSASQAFRRMENHICWQEV